MYLIQNIFYIVLKGKVTVSKAKASQRQLEESSPGTSTDVTVAVCPPVDVHVPFVHMSVDRTSFLPNRWAISLTTADMKWMSHALMTADGQLKDNLQLWNYPPQPPCLVSTTPNPDRYFASKLFLCMARRMWRVQLYCVHCSKKALTAKGLCNRIRTVVDVDCIYYIATEYLGCKSCNNSGYRSRMALHELLMGTDEIKRLIQSKARVDEIRSQAIKDGMTTLKQDGIEKIFTGSLDLLQVRKVCIK